MPISDAGADPAGELAALVEGDSAFRFLGADHGVIGAREAFFMGVSAGGGQGEKKRRQQRQKEKFHGKTALTRINSSGERLAGAGQRRARALFILTYFKGFADLYFPKRGGVGSAPRIRHKGFLKIILSP
jgi:hypothetical protein